MIPQPHPASAVESLPPLRATLGSAPTLAILEPSLRKSPRLRGEWRVALLMLTLKSRQFPANQLTTALLNHYLLIKQRGLL